MIVRRARPHATLKRREELLLQSVDRCSISIVEPTPLAFHIQWRNRMTKLKLLSAALIAAATLATPAMAREGHVTSRHVAEQANASAYPPPVILTAVSAFQRRASAHLPPSPGAGTMSLANLSRIESMSGEHQGWPFGLSCAARLDRSAAAVLQCSKRREIRAGKDLPARFALCLSLPALPRI